MTANDWIRLGKRIRKFRVERGLSQEDLAEGAYTAAYISHLEHGKRRASQDALVHVAERLGLTLEQLLSGRDPNDDLRLEIDIQQAIAGLHAGDVPASERTLKGALEQAEKSKNRRAVAKALEGLGQALYRKGDLEGALSFFRRAEGMSKDTPEGRTLARVGQARCLLQLSRVPEALTLLQSNQVELEGSESPDPTSLVATYAALIPIYFERGLIEKAKEVAREGWRLAPEVGDPEQKACLYLNRAQLLLMQDERREALASLALAEDLFAQLGWLSEWVKVGLAKALVLIDDDRLDDAAAILKKAADTKNGVSRTDRAQALTQLALIARLQGDTETAVDLATDAISAGRGQPVVVAEAHREAGHSLLLLDDGAAALEHWRDALKLFQKADNHEEVAKTARLIGDQLAKSGDTEGALEAYRQGLGGVKELR